jgi:hypothetical protein
MMKVVHPFEISHAPSVQLSPAIVEEMKAAAGTAFGC